MAFGDYIRADTIENANTTLFGIGGDSNVLYVSDASTGYIVKADASDFSTIIDLNTSFSNNYDEAPKDLAGDENVAWALTDDGVTQISPVTLEPFGDYSTDDGYYLAGGENVIWLADFSDYKELSTSDFSVVKSSSYNYLIPGIGGDKDALWSKNDDSGNIIELSTSDFSIINSRSDPHKFNKMGGGKDAIWADVSDEVWEFETPIDPPNAPSNLTLSLQ